MEVIDLNEFKELLQKEVEKIEPEQIEQTEQRFDDLGRVIEEKLEADPLSEQEKKYDDILSEVEDEEAAEPPEPIDKKEKIILYFNAFKTIDMMLSEGDTFDDNTLLDLAISFHRAFPNFNFLNHKIMFFSQMFVLFGPKIKNKAFQISSFILKMAQNDNN